MEGLITREHAIAAAQNAARNQGYAVAVHGSRVRDLDLVAVPWRETAIDADSIADIIAHAIPGEVQGKSEPKPYGRVAYVIIPKWRHGFDMWYIDLSVIPRAQEHAGSVATGYVKLTYGCEHEVHAHNGDPMPHACPECYPRG